MLREQTPKDAPAQPGQDMLHRTDEEKLHEERLQWARRGGWAAELEGWECVAAHGPLAHTEGPTRIAVLNQAMSPKHNQHRG